MEEIEEQVKEKTENADKCNVEKKGFFTYPITRKQYWLRVIAVFVAATIIGLIADAMLGGFYISYYQYFPAHNIVYIVELVFLIIFQVLRWHDAKKSGLFALLNLIPTVGPIIALIILGCLQSNHDNNK